jgi:hypothetical protein
MQRMKFYENNFFKLPQSANKYFQMPSMTYFFSSGESNKIFNLGNEPYRDSPVQYTKISCTLVMTFANFNAQE